LEFAVWEGAECWEEGAELWEEGVELWEAGVELWAQACAAIAKAKPEARNWPTKVALLSCRRIAISSDQKFSVALNITDEDRLPIGAKFR
jgi:hypothetical protein